MKRTVRDHRDVPHPKPVTRITLWENKPKLRLVLAILLVLIAVGAFGYGIHSSLSSEDGWTTIEVSSSADLNNSNEFVFQYLLGAGGISPTAEAKAVNTLYTEAMVKGYQLFNNDDYSGSLKNVYFINHHPNEEMEIDPVLYQAFALCEASGNRTIYLAPVYAQYDSIFYCQEDWETADFDPRQNQELADFFGQTITFTEDEAEVQVELLGDNRICLHVSEDYLAYAEQEGITSFIDFYWMKNAFIVDYAAEQLQSEGYTRGNISSYDGFVRNLDGGSSARSADSAAAGSSAAEEGGAAAGSSAGSAGGRTYGFNLYHREGKVVSQMAVMNYSGRRSIVTLRDYAMNSLDDQHYYELEDGQVRTAYLDTADGLCRASVPELVSYSEELGCAELLMQMIPCYIADTFESSSLQAYFIYCEDGILHANDPALMLTEMDENCQLQIESR